MMMKPWRTAIRIFGPTDEDTEECVYQHDEGASLSTVSGSALVATLRALADEIEMVDRMLKSAGVLYIPEQIAQDGSHD